MSSGPTKSRIHTNMSVEKEFDSTSPLEPHLIEEFQYQDEFIAGNIHREMHILWEDSYFVDINVVISGHTFPCHKLILAASSPYFKALFRHDESAANNRNLHIEGISPKGFGLLLGYFYSGQLNITAKNVVDVLEAADFLQFREITEFCFGILEQYMNASNCLAIARIADGHLCQPLYETAKEFAAANFENVILQNHFLEIPFEMVLEFLMFGSRLKIKHERSLLLGICKWISHKVDVRTTHKKVLLENINICAIEKEHLSDIIVDFPFLCDEDLLASCHSDFTAGIQHCTIDVTLKTDSESFTKSRPTEVPVMIPRDTSRKGSNSMYHYHPKESKWMLLASLPFSLRGLYTATELNNDIYICGGDEFEIPRDDVFRFDLSKKEWSDEQPMLKTRANHSAAKMGGKLYVIGGRGPKYFLLRKDGEVYDPMTKQWTILPDLLGIEGLGRCALVPLRGKLFVFGGTSSYRNERTKEMMKQQYHSAQYYSPRNDRFYECPVLSQALDQCNISVGMGDALPYHGFILIIDEDTKGRRMKLYNPVTGDMQEFLNTHGQHRFGGYVVTDNILYCIGGVMDRFRAHDLVHYRNMDNTNSEWELLASLPVTSSHHACLTVFLDLAKGINVK